MNSDENERCKTKMTRDDAYIYSQACFEANTVKHSIEEISKRSSHRKGVNNLVHTINWFELNVLAID